MEFVLRKAAKRCWAACTFQEDVKCVDYKVFWRRRCETLFYASLLGAPVLQAMESFLTLDYGAGNRDRKNKVVVTLWGLLKAYGLDNEECVVEQNNEQNEQAITGGVPPKLPADDGDNTYVLDDDRVDRSLRAASLTSVVAYWVDGACNAQSNRALLTLLLRWTTPQLLRDAIAQRLPNENLQKILQLWRAEFPQDFDADHVREDEYWDVQAKKLRQKAIFTILWMRQLRDVNVWSKLPRDVVVNLIIKKYLCTGGASRDWHVNTYMQQCRMQHVIQTYLTPGTTTTRSLHVLMFSPERVARSMFRVNTYLVSRLQYRAEMSWGVRYDRHSSPTLHAIVAFWNRCVTLVATCILLNNNNNNGSASSLDFAIRTFHHFIQVCQCLMQEGDYSSALCVWRGLNLSPVQRIRLFDRLPKEAQQQWTQVHNFFSPLRHLEDLKRIVDPNRIVIPFFGWILSGLCFVEEGNPTMIGSRFNVYKLYLLTKHFDYFKESQDKARKLVQEDDGSIDDCDLFVSSYPVLPEAELFRLAQPLRSHRG